MEENNMTEQEQIMKQVFLKLIEEVGYLHKFNFDNHTDLGCFCILKKDGRWFTFQEEKGETWGYSSFEYFVDLCKFLFTFLPKNVRNYCLDNFEKMVSEEERKVKTKG